MALKHLVAALSIIAAISPVSASQPDSGPIAADRNAPPIAVAPAGTAATRYCMRVELTGYISDPIRCWTRDQWADQGVDVDREWAKEGVRTVG